MQPIIRVYHQQLVGQCFPAAVLLLPATTEAVRREPSLGGRRWERRDPALMDAGTLGEESDGSHIWNFYQKAQQERGTPSMLFRLPSALRAKLQEKTQKQFTPLRNHYPQLKQILQLPGRHRSLRCRALISLSLCKSCGYAVCVHVCNHACVPAHWGRRLF